MSRIKIPNQVINQSLNLHMIKYLKVQKLRKKKRLQRANPKLNPKLNQLNAKDIQILNHNNLISSIKNIRH